MTHEDLRTLLAVAADGPPAPDLLVGVRRARRRRAVLVPATSLATAGALGAAAFVALSAGPGGGTAGAAELAAALRRTTGTSFTFQEIGDGSWHGAFDPARSRGWVDGPSGQHTVFAGDYIYTESTSGRPLPIPAGKRWLAQPRPTEATWRTVGLAFEVLKRGTSDPAAVFASLSQSKGIRSAGTASGDGWTGKKYAFTARSAVDAKAPEARRAALTITGTVSVDSAGLVRELDFTEVGGMRLVYTFGGFGTPVSVSAPPASEVYVETAGGGKPGAGKPGSPPPGDTGPGGTKPVPGGTGGTGGAPGAKPAS